MSRLMGDWTPEEYESGEPTAQITQTEDASQDQTQGPSLADYVVGLDELKGLEPPDPLISGLVYQGEMCQLTGAPGTGKSFVSLGWACAVASGQRAWEGHRIMKNGPVVYVSGEGVSGLWLRIAAWCQLNNVDPETLSGKLFVLRVAAQLGDIHDIAQLVQIVQEREAALVVFDTRARMTVGLDENSSQDQGRAIRNVDTVIRECGCAVVVVHHSSRAGTAGRGSSAWDGAVFSDLRLSKEKGTNDVTVECFKHKDAPDGCKHEYALKSVTVSAAAMPHRTDEQRQTLVAVQAGIYTDARQMKQVETNIIDMYRELAPADGLTTKQAEDFALSEKGIARATFFRHHRSLVERGLIVNVGPGKTKRYVAAANTIDYDEEDPENQ